MDSVPTGWAINRITFFFFIKMSEEMIKEINCGSYQTKLAPGYTTGMRTAQLDAARAAGGPAAADIQQFNEVG